MKEKQIRIVPSAWLEEKGRRLDCGPYLSGKIEAEVLLSRLHGAKPRLDELTAGGKDGIINAGRIRRIWVSDQSFGVPFLSSTDILQADLSSLSLIGHRAVRDNPQLLIRSGWILVTRSGTTGRMAYSRPDMDRLACSEDVLRIVPDPARVPSGFLYAFLRTKFGLPLIAGDTYGSVITHIEPGHVSGISVPRFGGSLEASVHAKITESSRLLAEYQRQLNAATKILFAAVGLNDISSGGWHNGNPDLGFARKLDSPASLRALNFTPRFQQLCDTIREKSWRPLGELCKPGTLRTGPRFKRIDADPEYAYQLIGQKEIFWVRAEGRWIAKTATPSGCLVPEGTTLVAAHGTFGESELYCRAEYIWGHDTGRAYSQDFLRVVPNDAVMRSGCMFAFLRSETAFRMFRAVSIGTKLQEHHPVFTAGLPVPYPPEHVQTEIHELVTDAYDKRHRSVKLEDEAVAIVEAAIEGGA